jgi:hypothetical protein
VCGGGRDFCCYYEYRLGGADGFSLEFFKIFLPHILSVITHLFNFSITTSTFPSAWKTSLVLHLPKCGSPTGLSDFRLISILPVYCLKGLRG